MSALPEPQTTSLLTQWATCVARSILGATVLRKRQLLWLSSSSGTALLLASGALRILFENVTHLLGMRALVTLAGPSPK